MFGRRVVDRDGAARVGELVDALVGVVVVVVSVDFTEVERDLDVVELVMVVLDTVVRGVVCSVVGDVVIGTAATGVGDGGGGGGGSVVGTTGRPVYLSNTIGLLVVISFCDVFELRALRWRSRSCSI